MVTIDTIRQRGREASRFGDRQAWWIVAAARVAGLVIRWTAAVERWRQRLDLLDLTDDQLRDIGVTRAQARREARRPFWG